jgi:quercetin dioxygenase-like cupin family protein
MRQRTAVVAILAGLGALGITATALATPQDGGFTGTRISTGHFDEIDIKSLESLPYQVRLKTKGQTDVHVTQNTVPPGGHSGWHTHPGPSLVTVVQGKATFYDADDPTCTPHVVEAPNGTIDIGDGHVHLLRNEGDEVLITVAVQFLPAGADRRIDAPDPGNCDF